MTFMCRGLFPACVSVYHEQIVPRRSEVGVEPLELDLKTVVRHHVDAGTQTLTLWRAAELLTSELPPVP